jgi:hypothetical protein
MVSIIAATFELIRLQPEFENSLDGSGPNVILLNTLLQSKTTHYTMTTFLQ